MRLRTYLQILTLVVCFQVENLMASPSLPAPSSAISSGKSQSKKEESPDQARPYELESLSLPLLQGEVPEGLRSKWTASRIVRRHSRTVLGSLWTGSLLERKTETSFGATLLFQNENRNESAQSYGLSVLANSAYGLHWDFQKHCCLGDFFEPNWGFGIGSLWSTGDALASLANIERYHFRGRLGFEDLFNLDRRLRAELVLKVSPLGFIFQAGLGWTWDETEFIF